jgi:pimeloyl-ACP methyl ester carboxylesterase
MAYPPAHARGVASADAATRTLPTVPIHVAGPDGRVLVAHDSGLPDPALTLVWHTGSPQTGALLAPVLDAAGKRRIRVVSYGRPSYGGSTPNPGRNVASAAADVAAVVDALDVDRFATMGASGGGPHALACGALLGERVSGVVTLAGIAPYTDEFDWFGGMRSPGGLRSALEGGRPARAAFAQTDEFDPAQFVEPDWAALEGAWGALGEDAQRAEREGPDGLIDDDCAFVRPWGFELAAVRAPVLVVQGGRDRVVPQPHGEHLARHLPNAELALRPADGHVSVLEAVPAALDRLLAWAQRTA